MIIETPYDVSSVCEGSLGSCSSGIYELLLGVLACCRGGWSFLFGKLLQHDLELLEVNLAIAIDVDLSDDVLPHSRLLADVVAEDGSDLLSFNSTTTILIEELEGGEHVWLTKQLDLVNGSSTPLAEIDLSTPIYVGLVEDLVGSLIDFAFVEFRVKGAVSLEELLSLNQAITVLIELVERVAELVLLFLGCKMSSHEGQRRLLQL